MPREKWRVLSNPSGPEKRAQRIEIECVEAPDGKSDGYIVCVTPKNKDSKPGKESKGYTYMNPIKRVFADDKGVIDYLTEIL
jgi:hypothetical protein